MGTGIDETLRASIMDPATRHCITCYCATKNINDEPCRTCLHTEPIGRARPLWVEKKEVIKNAQQQRLF